MNFVGVIDIGKTNAKFAVVDATTLEEVAVRTRPNTVLEGPPYPHFDIEGIWTFLKEAIAALNAEHRLGALSITTHGATAALLDDSGALSLPVLDYEHTGPDSLRGELDPQLDPFARSLTPRLPAGLNLIAQFHYQQRTRPEDFRRTRSILPYPQYWAYRLTGLRASELTSLGCHTGLWDFGAWDYGQAAKAFGFADLFAPLRSAFASLGPVRPDLAAALGLAPEIPVHCGIHDSNASLLPHILGRTPPFSVVSTGTWVIVAAPGGSIEGLDAGRDCLANIDALGRPVPSARFMGGREFSTLTDGATRTPDAGTVAEVLTGKLMLLPSVQQGSGPFPDRKAHWSQAPESLSTEARYLVVSYYLALMTAQCLALTGAGGPTLVEGPFARNRAYLDMLCTATSRPVHASTDSATGTSTGAAILALGRSPFGRPEGAPHAPEADRAALQAYAQAWRDAL